MSNEQDIPIRETLSYMLLDVMNGHATPESLVEYIAIYIESLEGKINKTDAMGALYAHLITRLMDEKDVPTHEYLLHNDLKMEINCPAGVGIKLTPRGEDRTHVELRMLNKEQVEESIVAKQAEAKRKKEILNASLDLALNNNPTEH